MHVLRLLQTAIEKSFPNIHKKRVQCTFDVVSSLIDCGKLWISALGRGIKNKSTSKHNIKKVDTLIGNTKLHRERECVYRYVSDTWLSKKKRPVIIVDWSPIAGDCKHYFLRASVTGIGRAITIYEEVHAQKHYANNTIHKYFLRKLNHNVNLYIFQGKNKGRVKKTIQGEKCRSSNSKKYAKGSNEPWVLVTSLPPKHNTAKKVMKLYKLRMQIEGAFKDIKNKRYGFRLPESGTKNIMRLENLILIALLAMVAVWLIGQVGLSNKWQYQLQANTVRNIAVLSITFLGIHILRNLSSYKVNKKELINAFDSIRDSIMDWANYNCTNI